MHIARATGLLAAMVCAGAAPAGAQALSSSAASVTLRVRVPESVSVSLAPGSPDPSLGFLPQPGGPAVTVKANLSASSVRIIAHTGSSGTPELLAEMNAHSPMPASFNEWALRADPPRGPRQRSLRLPDGEGDGVVEIRAVVY